MVEKAGREFVEKYLRALPEAEYDRLVGKIRVLRSIEADSSIDMKITVVCCQVNKTGNRQPENGH
jgi:hypothetical protein